MHVLYKCKTMDRRMWQRNLKSVGAVGQLVSEQGTARGEGVWKGGSFGGEKVRNGGRKGGNIKGRDTRGT